MHGRPGAGRWASGLGVAVHAWLSGLIPVLSSLWMADVGLEEFSGVFADVSVVSNHSSSSPHALWWSL